MEHNGFKVEYDLLGKDKKKYCGNPSSFEKDLDDLFKLIIGTYLETGTLMGDFIKDVDDLKVHKKRQKVICFNIGPSDGYRVVYGFLEELNTFVVVHAYIKSHNKIKSELIHIKQILEDRLGNL